MTGLRLMNQLMDPNEREALLAANTNTVPGAFAEVVEIPEPVAYRPNAAKKCAWIFRYPQCRIWIAASATFLNWRAAAASGATSIHTCCTAGISVTRAT